MSQVLVEKGRASLYQDLFSTQKIMLKSSAKPPQCHVCQRELENEMPITAKNMGSEILFFCDLHQQHRYLVPKFRR